MTLKSPSLREKHLSLENLESRQMMSGISVASLQYDTAMDADTVLRAQPVELLEGTSEFNGSQVVSSADSPVFTDGSFSIEAMVRPNSIREQVIVSKYNTQQSSPDQGFLLSMLPGGRLQFIVYQEGGGSRIAETNGAVLTAGAWQRVLAGFDIENQTMTISVDGKELPTTLVDGSQEVTKIRDGTTAVRVGEVYYGSGRTNVWAGGMQNVRFWPIAPHAEQIAANDAAIAEVATEEETAGEQRITSAAIDAVLRAEPVELLKGTREFNGSQVLNIADSPVFTDGSFTIELSVRPDALRGQTFVSKYDSQSAQDQGFYLGMYPDGRLQFSVYGNGGDYRLLNTTEAPLVVGKWQKIRASFDIVSQKMMITVDGREIPATIPAAASKEIRTIHDGTSPVRVGASVFVSGLQDFLKGAVQDVTFYPVSQYGIPKQEAAESSAATNAAIAKEAAVLPLAEAEALTTTQELTSEAVQTVLTAKDIVALRGEWNREQEEFRVAEGRTSSLLDGIAADRDDLSNLQKDLQDKRTALTAKETGLRQCQDALEPLAAEVQRLTDLTAALTNEQQSLPGRITALGQQVADGQKTLQDTIAARDAIERTLVSIRQQAKQGEKDYSYQLKVYRQNWRNKALLNKVNALREKINDLLRQEQLLQTQSTNLSKKAVACQNSLSSATTELTIAKTRQAALPGELSGTIAARDAAGARLGTLPEEEARLVSEIATLRETVSAQTAEADLLSRRITDAQNDLPTAFLTEAQEWQDVSQMRRTVDAALLTVFEEDAASAGASKLHVEATEDAQSLSLSERQLLQYRTRMTAAQERLAERGKNLDTAQARVLALNEIAPGEIDPSKKADLASLVPHARMAEDQALADWQIARRETIAYPDITAIEPHVTQNRNGQVSVTFSVRYRTPDTESVMEVYRNGVRVQETLLRHPAGEPDGEFDFNPGDSSSSGDLEFRYSSRGAEGIKNAGRATARYNTRELPRNAASVGTIFSAVESHDIGRLVDHPLPYALKIMSINGRSAVLHFTSPDDESMIVSSTGGLYGQDLRSHPGGTATGVSLVTLNPTKIGRYSFFLMDQRGTPRCAIDVNFDGTTLTPVNQDDQWTSEAATTVRMASLAANNPGASPALRIATSISEEAVETLEQERLELLLEKQINLSTNPVIDGVNRTLWETQAQDLYERSSLFVSQEKMHEYFFTVHPDWRPENFQATVMRMWTEGGRKGQSGDTRDWLNGVIRDQLGRFDRDLNVFSAAAAEIMQKGVRACLAIRQGSPEGPLFREIDELIVGRGYWEAVGRLKAIGVSLPTRHEVIAEATRIVAQRIDDLVFKESENSRLHDNYAARQRSGIWSPERDGGVNVSVLAERRTVERGYTQQEVSESEARRLRRATDLVLQARIGNDPRARMSVVISDEPNIQRERQLANGTTQIVITTAEAEQLATKMDEAITESGVDATVVGIVVSREVVAMVGGFDVTVEGVNMEEQLHFGEELTQYLAAYGNNLAQGFQNILESFHAQDAVESYVKIANDAWVVTRGTAGEAGHTIAGLTAGNGSPITSQGSTLLRSTGPEQSDAENYATRSLKQVLLGNYSDSVTAAGTAGQIAMGFTGIDLPADIRDVVYDITHWEWRWGHLGQTAFDSVAFLPVIGVLKYGDEVHVLLRSGEGEVVRLVGKMGDEYKGFFDLAAMEQQFGHVLRDHVGKTDAELLRRLQEGPENMQGASSFANAAMAQDAIRRTIAANAGSIDEWLKHADTFAQGEFTFESSTVFGRGIMRGDTDIHDITGVIVRLKKLENGGYTLITAYPTQL